MPISNFCNGTRAPWARGLTASLLLSVLAACGGGGSEAETGTLKLALTDAPGCGYDHVYVTVAKIRIHQSANATGAPGEAGWSELNIPPQRIDLLALTNGVLQELGSLPLPVGQYQQIRLVLGDNPSQPSSAQPLANAVVLTGSGQEIPLSTPSGQQSGFKLQAHFDVAAGQVADMVLDFNACRSIVVAGKSGNYQLKPVVSVIKRLTTAIEGYVDPAIAARVVVSTRDPDNQLRATVPDATTGKFTLAYLPESAQYTVVVAGQDLTTAAITGVPVSLASSITPLNTQATAISLPVSVSGNVVGVVRNSNNALLTDASVVARQTLGTGQVLEVGATGVNATDATYRLSLPLAAPLAAPYVGGNTLVFAPDTAAAGRYDIVGTAAGYTGQSTAPAVTLTGEAELTHDLTLQP